MSVDEAVQPEEEVDEPGWEVDPDDEWGVAVITMVGRQLKLLREAAGMRAPQFGALIGYGEDLVYKVEGGKRIPKRQYLVNADRVLNANGVIEATWEDVKKVRYPKGVRDLGKLEAKAVEIGVYESQSINGLLQIPEHARALIQARQPPYSPDDLERMVAARLARQSVEHLLEVGRLHNVTLQVMPTNAEPHPGLDGRIELLKFPDGTAVGRSDGVFNGRPVSEPKHLHILELRYGTIRAQALSPRESLPFIEQLLGET
ncbi:helix-turn-helix domain-containing protein [Streptomyces sp. AM6-12]|uniref:helix-turn-helix domain-containing protein n=1 Tax=Streptomyces sp. AM6-12 TaxID=3345149 RepID=UPI00378A81A3